MNMNINEFKSLITVINGSNANIIRSKYIDRFIVTDSEYYKNNILTTQNYSDGRCYIGYMWDCVTDVRVIDSSYIQAMRKSLGKVYVLWDIHTKDRIFIADYWKFNKCDILYLDFNLLLDNLECLPEDIYIFDSNYNWTFILTHENIDEKRWCLMSGNI